MEMISLVVKMTGILKRSQIKSVVQLEFSIQLLVQPPKLPKQLTEWRHRVLTKFNVPQCYSWLETYSKSKCCKARSGTLWYHIQSHICCANKVLLKHLWKCTKNKSGKELPVRRSVDEERRHWKNDLPLGKRYYQTTGEFLSAVDIKEGFDDTLNKQILVVRMKSLVYSEEALPKSQNTRWCNWLVSLIYIISVSKCALSIISCEKSQELRQKCWLGQSFSFQKQVCLEIIQLSPDSFFTSASHRRSTKHAIIRVNFISTLL